MFTIRAGISVQPRMSRQARRRRSPKTSSPARRYADGLQQPDLGDAVRQGLQVAHVAAMPVPDGDRADGDRRAHATSDSGSGGQVLLLRRATAPGSRSANFSRRARMSPSMPTAPPPPPGRRLAFAGPTQAASLVDCRRAGLNVRVAIIQVVKNQRAREFRVARADALHAPFGKRAGGDVQPLSCGFWAPPATPRWLNVPFHLEALDCVRRFPKEIKSYILSLDLFSAFFGRVFLQPEI